MPFAFCTREKKKWCEFAEAAEASGKSASICGEIAGDHWFTPILVGLGFRELSMAPVFLPRTIKIGIIKKAVA